MKVKRTRLWITGWACVLMGLAVLIPGLLVERIDEAAAPPHASEAELAVQEERLTIRVHLADSGQIESVPLETYVRGVVAAEMPIEFEVEALKAQAIAARTYIVRRMAAGDFSDMAVSGAIVTDTVKHQAYISEKELGNQWPWWMRPRNLAKLNRAVSETAGLIATYEGEPIQAVYFSTSNGYTENSEEYWSEAVPYLRSVPSPWDAELSPKYRAVVELDAAEALRKLGIAESAAGEGTYPEVRILEKTAGHRVKKVRIAGHEFTGREVREKLGLASAHFEWEWKEGKAVITTYGYGHGIGMSQYGANALAKQGKSARDIIRYYYQGADITKWTPEAGVMANL